MLKAYGKCGLYRKHLLKIKHSAKLCSTRREQLKADELEQAYCPGRVEGLYDGQGYFESKTTSDKVFRMILPPPNITGTLHLGHALTATIQDVIVRTKRMQGIPTLWIPGIDHAGIATQVVVEKRLWKENHQTRHDVGREVFQQQVWKWKEEKAGVIEEQLRRLGVSLDWSREVFTLDPSQSRAVTAAFVKLFDQGLIYRADQIVNWSCVLQSAISDIEVDHLEIEGPTAVPVPGYDKPVEFGRLTHFAYKFADSKASRTKDEDEELVVATTRPETMLGDVAVAVNPKDDRYGRHIGRNLWHPFRKQTIPIICDDFVDPAFGTGAVKLTPAHDRIDFDAGKRHGLDVLSVIDEGGNLTDVCGEFSGVRRFDARDIVVSELERLGLLRGRQDHRMIVPICSRSKDVVEFLVRPQWFVKCKEMADRAAEDVRQGRLVIEPKNFEATWFNWLENIRDWCVSRQLWWGHRIPAYICHAKDRPAERVWVAAETVEAAQAKAATRLSTVGHNVAIQQDEDVLDTWFSSGLMPFSVFGWPQQNEDFSNYYPLSMMETGHDILFFWVARMAMLGSQLTGQLPFNKVLLHGMICDAQGRKMSKSLGNVVSPEDVILGSTLETLENSLKARAGILSTEELQRAVQGQKKMFPAGIPECGSDALRFTLCSRNIKSHFINFDVQECHTNKLFCNKIWQATKFTNIWMDKVSQSQELRPIVGLDKLTSMDRWILSRLSALVRKCWESCEMHEFHTTTAALKQFLYYDFCDVYLETTKRGLRRTEEGIAAGHCWTLTRSLGDALRLLAPFMPRLAQHLHRNLYKYPGETEMYDYPQICDELRDESLENQVEDVKDTVVAIRRMKKIFGVVAKHKPEVYIVVGDDRCSLYGEFREAIEDLAACHKVNVCGSHPDKTLIKNAVAEKLTKTGSSIYLTIPDELRRTVLELDMPKLEAKKSKLMKELNKMEKMIYGDSHLGNATAEAQEVHPSDSYLKNATAEAQKAHSKKVDTLKDKLTRINYIQTLAAAAESQNCTT